MRQAEGKAEASSIVAAVDVERRRWRENLLQGLLWTTLGSVVATLIFTLPQGLLRWAALPFVVIAALLLGTALARRLPFGLRASVLFGTVFAACGLAIVAAGAFAPNALVALCALVVTATVLLGRRWALCVMLLAIVVLIAAAGLHGLGLIDRPQNWYAPFDIGNAISAARMIAVFATTSTILLVSISMMLARTERLLVEKAAALEAIERERAEKERVQRDLELREDAFRKAREIELIGRLAGCAAHDINNALTVITGYAGVARRADGNAAVVAEALSAIDAAVASATATTRDLRAFGPQAGGPSGPLSLPEQVERSALMFRRLFPANIDVRVTVESVPAIRAGESAVQRTITNLALNARDAMREGGTLWLRVRRARDAEVPGQSPGARKLVALEVEDSGSGMDEPTLAKIFEPFFTTKGAAGTGLGLASVRALIAELGGHLTVTSTPGQGTRFVVFWPVAEGVLSLQHSLAEPLARAPSARVLVVDDDRQVRTVIALVLSEQGYAVSQAGDVRAALSVLRDAEPPIEILLTDCAMPGPPVSELVQAFRECSPKGRVLMCTGYAAEETSLPADVLDAYLLKPFSGAELLAAVGTAADRARA